VAVPPDRAGRTVRSFGTSTEDLLARRDGLKEGRVTTVAMEATSAANSMTYASSFSGGVSSLLQTSNEPVVFAMMPNPEPDDVGATLNSNRSIMDADTR